MKISTTAKAAIATLFTILLAFLFYQGYLMFIGEDTDTTLTKEFQDIMIDSRNIFLEKSDPIQHFTYLVLNMSDLSVLRAADGKGYVETNSGLIPAEDYFDESITAYLNEILGLYFNGGTIYNIKVTEEAVLFFTAYHKGGVSGFLYEKELGNTKYYDKIELTENWNIFYKIRY